MDAYPKARFTITKNGFFSPRMALSTLSAPAEPVRLLERDRAGTGVAWSSLPQTLVWPEAIRQFNGFNCGTSAVQAVAIFLSITAHSFLSLRTASLPPSTAQKADA